MNHNVTTNGRKTAMTATKTDTHQKLHENAYAGWCKCCGAAFFVVILFATSSLKAVPITVPSDLNVGDKYRLAFVTSTVGNANSSDFKIKSGSPLVTAA